MRKFMDKDFLLSTDTAKWLYHEVAEELPIIDYHCHINPREIAEDRKFQNITEVWLGGDHYKWRVMRAAGVPEEKITGTADAREKFRVFAETMPRLIGNPIYHWSHLELQRGFGITEPLTRDNADRIYDRCNEILKGCSARQFIETFDVKALCTTDDPADDLYWHEKIAENQTMSAKVYPAFRPDKAINIEKSGFAEYIRRLSEEADAYKTVVTIACAKKYAEMNWVMQIHFGCLRDNHKPQFAKLGPDTGYDAVNSQSGVENLAPLLNAFVENKGLPKMILYSLNPADNTAIATIMACFQGGGVVGRMQQGSAWWFNDHRPGIRTQLTDLASNGVLGLFVGMLTDSRSFLSYTRHEYFRRVICELVGEWVESGQYPEDKEQLTKLIADLSYYNTKDFFGFDVS